MDETQKHYTEEKKPDTKQYTMYDVIYIKPQNKPIYLIQLFSIGTTDLPGDMWPCLEILWVITTGGATGF